MDQIPEDHGSKEENHEESEKKNEDRQQQLTFIEYFLGAPHCVGVPWRK